MQFRCEAGNTNDSPTHIATWDALCRAAGGPDFLYVADSKLCVRAPVTFKKCPQKLPIKCVYDVRNVSLGVGLTVTTPLL